MARRGWWGIAAVSAVHFVAQVAVMVAAIGSGLARFDQGGEPGLAEHGFDLAAAVLHFPLVMLARALPLRGTGHWGWVILLANSALWGIAVTVAWRRVNGQRTRCTGLPADAPAGGACPPPTGVEAGR